jgi:hypothetical protein
MSRLTRWGSVVLGMLVGMLAVAGCDLGDPSTDRPVVPETTASPDAPATPMGSGVAAGGAGGIMPATSTPPPVTSGPTAPPTLTPDPFAARGAPVRLEIPAIRVDAALETGGFTKEGAIGAPKDWDKAAWHSAGFRPGEPGNALIAGHLDNDRGGPAVFWDLNELAVGDEVRVTYANGESLTFQVGESELVDSTVQDSQTFDRILGPADEPRLNLMTCDGAWDQGAATYTKRLVVFTRLAPDAQGFPSSLP